MVQKGGARPLGDRLRDAFLEPADPGASHATSEPRSLEELEASANSLEHKERLIALLAAPVAALISILVIGAMIAKDPAARLKDGLANPAHVDVSEYHDLLAVMLLLSMAMLTTALWRKRLYLGIVTALYGLALFNLHWWGFGIPYIMCAAWLLVRAYRMQRDLREARGDAPRRAGTPATGRVAARPGVSKRYTPPVPSASRSSAGRSPRARPSPKRRAV